MIHRRISLATLAVVAVGLSACSSSNAATSTTFAGSSTVLLDTTTVAGTTLPDTTAAPTSAAPATAAPTTAAPVTAAPTTAAPAGPGLYEAVTPPVMPAGSTEAFVPSGALANGRYWVVYNGGETMTPDITVLQAFFGSECTAQAAADGDECLNDIYIRGNPSRDMNDMPFAPNALISVADANGPGVSYAITPDELRTVRAGSPSDAAPDTFEFVTFAWLMTVQGGQIVKFEQVWSP
jgi:hypothetical protein